MSIMVYMLPDATPQSLREMFDECVSQEIQRAFLTSLFENYKQASETCYSEFSGPQAKTLSGHYRLAKIEEEWAGIASRFPSLSVQIKSYRYRTGTYNEITSGRVVLTQSCVASPEEAPRHADFRQGYARSGQLKLGFEDGSAEHENDRKFLYAIFIHGVDVLTKKRDRPAFARIEFPDSQCAKYLPGGIDLFARFPQVVASYVTKQSLVEVQPRRRQWRKRESA